MPRRTRRELVGRIEQYEQAEREQELVELESELHTEWRTTSSDDDDTDEPNAC